jgi:biopolymer transport protein ExbD
MSSLSSEAIEAASSANTDDEMLFKRRRSHGAGELITGLNLTAMMDVLTILLVYLIKVYADAPENITLNDDLRPPTSSAPANIVPSVSVLISKTAILVDNKKILDIDKGQIAGTDPSYLPLAQALDKRVELIRAIHKGGGAEFDGNLMIIADEDTPYDLVSNVLYQAGRAEFTNYRLVVRRK